MKEASFERLLKAVGRLSHVQASGLLRRALARIDELREKNRGGGEETPPQTDGELEPREVAPSPPTSNLASVTITRDGRSDTLVANADRYGVCADFGVIVHIWKGRTDVLILNCFEDDAGDYETISVWMEGRLVVDLMPGCIPPEWCRWDRHYDGSLDHAEAVTTNRSAVFTRKPSSGLKTTIVGGVVLGDEKTGKIGGGQGIYPYQAWARASVEGTNFAIQEMVTRAQRHPMWRLDREEMEQGRLVPKLYDEPASLVTFDHTFPRLSRYRLWSDRAKPYEGWLAFDEQHLSRFTGPVSWMADLGDPTAKDLLAMLGATVVQAWTMYRSEFKEQNSSFWSLGQWMGSEPYPKRQGAGLGTGSPALGREAAHTLRALHRASQHHRDLERWVDKYRIAIRYFQREDGCVFWDSSDSYAAPYRAALGGSGARLCMMREPQLLLVEMLEIGGLDAEVLKLQIWIGGPNPGVCRNVDTGEETGGTAPWGHMLAPWQVDDPAAREQALKLPFLDSGNPGMAVHPSLWEGSA